MCKLLTKPLNFKNTYFVRFFLIAIFTLLAGCETFNGVSRSGADFKTFDYQDCVDRTLRAQNGIKYEGVESKTRDKVVSLSGFKTNTDWRFTYRINEIPNSLQAAISITDRYDGTSYINHNYGVMNRLVSENDKETAAQYISKINVLLKMNCSVVID